jgi:uncharacterized protein YndB with AHSA1/START domain
MNTEPQRTAPAPTSHADREIVLSRVYDAPRALVFDAFTDAKHLPNWWGPRGFTITTQSIDVRVGGKWSFMMHGPDGTDFPNRIVYREIARPDRIVYDHDEGHDDDPNGFNVTVTFEDAGGKTRLTMRMLLKTAEQKAYVVGFGAIELGNQTLEKLAEHLAATR